MEREERIATLMQALDERILLLDGAMGTMIQGFGLTEEDYRGERFADFGRDLKGNNDLLSMTRPDIIRDDSQRSSSRPARTSLRPTPSIRMRRRWPTTAWRPGRGAEYGASARIARELADAFTAKSGRPRFVAGVLGPTNRTASISPDVNDPGFRNIRFDELADTYEVAATALIEGGVDFLMIETIFDTLNAKAAIAALKRSFRATGVELPVMISGTITDASGRTLSGQTTEAFWNSVRHVNPFMIGLNCALGASELRPYVAELARVADTRVSAHPNAGLPNEFGEYDETPEEMAAVVGEFASSGLVNLVGGCCGTRPDHIRALGEAVRGSHAAKSTDTAGEMPPVGTRAVQHRTRRPVRQRGRALQRHRIGRFPPPDRGRRLLRLQSRSRASRSRTARRSSTSTWTRACSIRRRRWSLS